MPLKSIPVHGRAFVFLTAIGGGLAVGVILLDFAGIVFMNNAVARKLADLRSDRLTIINCSPFIETLLETVER